MFFLFQVSFLAAFTVCFAVSASGMKITDKNNQEQKNPLMEFLEKFQEKVLKETGTAVDFDIDTVSKISKN